MGLGFSPAAAAEQDRIDAAVAGLYACCDELTAQRHKSSGEDLISALIAAEVDGQRLSAEELMRVNPATPVIGRVATEDFAFQDVDFPAGTHVALFVAAANTEPDTFGDAPFDITAPRAAQLTFGGGIHYCLGVWLARTEMREALPILASRLGDLALAGPVPSRPHVGITGPVILPLRFTGSRW